MQNAAYEKSGCSDSNQTICPPVIAFCERSPKDETSNILRRQLLRAFISQHGSTKLRSGSLIRIRGKKEPGGDSALCNLHSAFLPPGPCHFNKEQTPLAILRYQPTVSRWFFRCLGGKPPAKPLKCKSVSNRLGARFRQRWTKSTGGKPRLSCA